MVALGHENELVASAQFGQGLGHARQQLDLLLGDGAGKAQKALGSLFGERSEAELRKAGGQRAGKAGESVAVGQDGLALDGVQRLAHLGGRELVVVKEADEVGDGALEVDVILP